MCAGETFPSVHRNLLDSGVSRREAFTITMRVFRSGGLTKNAVYLPGLGDVLAYVGAGGDLGVLGSARWHSAMSPTSRSSAKPARSSTPCSAPRYLADTLAQQRLARITARTVPVDLIGAAA